MNTLQTTRVFSNIRPYKLGQWNTSEMYSAMEYTQKTHENSSLHYTQKTQHRAIKRRESEFVTYPTAQARQQPVRTSHSHQGALKALHGGKK